MITVTSSAFEEGQPIPKAYTGDGRDVSPSLAWSGAPEETREFALICDDPDAPRAEPWVHWVVYRIPGSCAEMQEGGTGAAVEGTNSWGRTGYNGPLPPPGHGTHHYHFKIYALDTPVDLAPGATRAQVLDAVDGHLIDEGELVGTYER